MRYVLTLIVPFVIAAVSFAGVLDPSLESAGDGTAVTDARNACERRGGQCVALVPGACKDGVMTSDRCGRDGDPNPPLGVTCCVRP